MKDLIKKIPFLSFIARIIYFFFLKLFKLFPGSKGYWEKRYESGRTSGDGSYGRLAQFKAEIINGFVIDKQISSVIEYGCGDGNQLRLSEYPSYIGFDVSRAAISQCRHTFANDETKAFNLVDEYVNEKAQLTLSLDVIYHLTEDEVYYTYMKQLFNSSTKFVGIYSSNTDEQARFQAPHVRHRNFSKWIEENRPEWKLIQNIQNKYPYSGDEKEGSFADFYFYEIA